jgi:DNA-binding NtrC family response regulator
LEEIKSKPDAPEVFVLTGHGSVPEAVQAMRLGVFDFITKPVSVDTLESVILAGGLRRGVGADSPEQPSIVTEFLPPGLRSLGMQALQIAKTNLPMLISGEYGVGKKRFAQFIHKFSNRSGGPFVHFQAGAHPGKQVESELFGSGFTTGAYQAAQQGTLVIEDIASLPFSTQERLLAWMDGRESAAGEPLNVRLIALTQSGLENRVESKSFHESLFFRLSGFTITIPPLRRRIGDIEELVRTHLAKEIAGPALEALAGYEWPGNVEELFYVLQQAERFASEVAVIRKHHLDSALALSDFSGKMPLEGPLTLEEMELSHIRRVLRLAGGNQTRAAKLLGIDPKTLYRKLKGAREMADPS